MQAIIAVGVVPCTLCLGLFGRQKHTQLKRLEADRLASEGSTLSGSIAA